jgi:hypothetical protein
MLPDQQSRRWEGWWIAAIFVAILAVTWTVVAIRNNSAEAESDAAIRETIQNLPPEDKDRLRASKEQFDRLDEAGRERIRELRTSIEARPDSEQLRHVMHEYTVWAKSRLTPAQRADLRERPVEERIKRVKQIRLEQSLASVDPLSDEDFERLQEVLREAFERRMERNRSEERRNDSDGERDGRRDRGGRRGRGGRGRGGFANVLEQGDFEKLREKLSQTAAAELDQRSELDEKRAVVNQWVMLDWQRPREESITDSELEKFFGELEEPEKERLLMLPERQMDQELRQLYMFRRYQGEGDGRGRGEGRGRGRSDNERRNGSESAEGSKKND